MKQRIICATEVPKGPPQGSGPYNIVLSTWFPINVNWQPPTGQIGESVRPIVGEGPKHTQA